MSILRIMVSFLSEMTSFILISILSQRKILWLTSFWQEIDVAQGSFFGFWCHFTFEAWFPLAFMMSKQAFMTSLILTGDVISIKMLSLFIYGHKKTKLQRLQQPSELHFLWIFGCKDVFAWVSTWENIFSTGENSKGIQLGRIRVGFSKHWFCGNRIGYRY